MSVKSLVVLSFVVIISSAANAATIHNIYPAIVPTDNALNLVYSPANGGLQVVLSGAANESKKITSLQINSSSDDFIGTRPSILTNAFDVFRPDRLFKFDTAGFGPSIDFGTPLAAGRSASALFQSLSVTGSFLGGGSLDQASYRLIYPVAVPEPGSIALVCIGTLLCLPRYRRLG